MNCDTEYDNDMSESREAYERDIREAQEEDDYLGKLEDEKIQRRFQNEN